MQGKGQEFGNGRGRNVTTPSLSVSEMDAKELTT